jgi:hypothetical protein
LYGALTGLDDSFKFEWAPYSSSWIPGKRKFPGYVEEIKNAFDEQRAGGKHKAHPLDPPPMAGSPPPNNMDTLIETLQSQVLECFVAADDLPQDIAFHRSLDRQFRKDIEKTSARLLKFANRLIAYAGTHSPASAAKVIRRNGEVLELQDEEDIADKYHSIIVDAMDSLLEHAVCAIYSCLNGSLRRTKDVSLDIYTGRLPAPRKERTSKQAVKDAAQVNVSDSFLVHAKLVFHWGGSPFCFPGRFLMSRHLA